MLCKRENQQIASRCRILPAFVTYFVDKYFNIKIKFKSISLLNASIQNIHVKWSGHEIVSVPMTTWKFGKTDISFPADNKWQMNLIKISFQFVGELGLKSKYLSSEYRKPFCLEIEDVKLCRTFDNDLETEKQNTSSQETRELLAEKRKNEVDRYISVMRDNFNKVFNYLLQFLPPGVMIIAQVSVI